jgi:hypothetical protein
MGDYLYPLILLLLVLCVVFIAGLNTGSSSATETWKARMLSDEWVAHIRSENCFCNKKRTRRSILGRPEAHGPHYKDPTPWIGME